jgi:hypothetical protein
VIKAPETPFPIQTPPISTFSRPARMCSVVARPVPARP